jgi:hypothetical protein
VHVNAELNDAIAFEVPTYAAAKALLARLRPTRRAEIEDVERAWTVVVELRPDCDDLAVLLRDVESWLEVSGLGAIRFLLDGRDYVLDACESVWVVAVPERR